jgi:inosose dehydratase
MRTRTGAAPASASLSVWLGLAAALCAAASLSAGAAAAAPPRVVAQMYVWQQYNQEHTQRLEDHLNEAFAVTARAGYAAVQGFLTWFATPAEADATAAALTAQHVRLVAAYADGPLHDTGADATIARIVERATRAKRHGVLTVIVNPDVRRDGAEKTDEELAVQARNLDRLGAALKAIGVALAIHAHDKEMRSGAREWYSNLRNTDPSTVGICLDVHWVYRGGQDPLALLGAAGSRIRDLHLRNSRGGVWLEDLSAGDIDYAKVAKALRDVKFSGTYTVELAYEPRTVRTRSLEDDLRTSREFVRRAFRM